MKTTYAAPEGIYYGQWLARRSVTDGGLLLMLPMAVTSPQKSRVEATIKKKRKETNYEIRKVIKTHKI